MLMIIFHLSHDLPGFWWVIFCCITYSLNIVRFWILLYPYWGVVRGQVNIYVQLSAAPHHPTGKSVELLHCKWIRWRFSSHPCPLTPSWQMWGPDLSSLPCPVDTREGENRELTYITVLLQVESWSLAVPHWALLILGEGRKETEFHS